MVDAHNTNYKTIVALDTVNVDRNLRLPEMKASL